MPEADRHLDTLIERYPILKACRASIGQAFRVLESCFAGGGKVLICGNGGSASDAEHVVAELMKGFECQRPAGVRIRKALEELGKPGLELYSKLNGALPAIALSAHTSLSTAILNDMDASVLFAQQVAGYGRAGDTLLAISTSGNSENVLNAVTVAKALDLSTVGFTGGAGGRLAPLCDVTVSVPGRTTREIQELHLPVYHALCGMLEDRFFGGSAADGRT